MTASPDATEDQAGAEVASAASFDSLRLHDLLLTELRSLGYESPTPIQTEAIPHLIAGRDLLGQAATGTGKTAAFALPILHRLATEPDGGSPRALVLAPTRELCMQVSAAVHRYGRGVRARTLPVYGGQPIGRQTRELKAGVDVVIATPGRALDHLRRGTLSLDAVATVVLDEADEMLDMGFAEDIDEILAACPDQRQTVLFSATMPRRILGIAQRHLQNPVRIEIGRAVPAADGGGSRTRQTAYIVSRQHKVAALGRILDMESPVATLVFCRTRDEVDQLAETLNGRGYRAEALHGGMDQQQRDRVMGRLRSRNAELLVCTDVAARGLDVEHLSHVVNFDVPSAPESYVHRIGRVGRGGRDGVAITIAEPREHRLLKTIGRVTRQDISVERLPSSADLHNRRLELTRAALYEVCLDDDLDDYRVVLDSLSDDFDVVRVALAAVKLAHRQTTPEGGEEEIPQPDRQDRGDRRGRDERPGERRPRKDRGGESGARSGKTGDRRTGDDRDDERARDDRGDDSKGRRTGKGKSGDDSRHSGPGRRERDPRRGADDASQQGARPPKPGRKDRRSEPTARVFISAGRASGLRPQDVVGAIANEAGLSGRDIGAIEIADRFAIVEVPQSSGKDVIAALNRTRLQGNRVKARYDRR